MGRRRGFGVGHFRRPGVRVPMAAGSTGELESAVMRWIVATLRDCGIRFWRLGQYVAEKTQDAGPADIVFFDRRRRRTVWLEAKREEGGVQSADQREFQIAAEAAGDVYLLLNDQQVLIDFLTAPVIKPKEGL